jgi:hypothetical protein
MLHIAKPAARALIVLMVGFVLVHASAGEGVAQTSKGKKKSEPTAAAKTTAKTDQLPIPVAEMRDGILEAVRSGRIEDLSVPIAWNELPPTFATEKVEDPIAYWKKQSADGEGREILAVLANLFAAGHATVPAGKDVENSQLFVWPRFAEQPLDKLTPEDEVQLYRLVSPSQLKAMREKKKWTWWRVAIGADGTWHAFQKLE